MQLYDATNKKGICQKIDRLCDTTDTTYPRLDKTSEVNEAQKDVISEIINADGTWQWDDTNQTDQPRGKGDFVEGQEPYTFASDYLQVEAMDYLDLDGITYRKLKPLDHDELNGRTPDEHFGLETNGNPKKGVPEYYDLFSDDSFRIYPAPGAAFCTLTNGYRVWFKRNPVGFTATSATTADTAEPAFAVCHDVLAYMASIPYCMKYHPERVALYEKKAMELQEKIINHYGQREKDKRKIISMKPILYR